MPGIEARAPERTGDEKRVFSIAETLADLLADFGKRSLHIFLQAVREVLVIIVIGRADISRDGEARRHRQSQIGHLGKVRALAAEQVFHRRIAFSRAVAKAVNPLRRRSIFGPVFRHAACHSFIFMAAP